MKSSLVYLKGTASVNNVEERAGRYWTHCLMVRAGEERSRTHIIQCATSLFIMKINSNHQRGKYTEQLTLQVVMLPGLLVKDNFGFLVSQASVPSHGHDLRLETRTTMMWTSKASSRGFV